MTIVDTRPGASPVADLTEAPGRTQRDDRRSVARLRPTAEMVVHTTETIRVDWRTGEAIEALVPAWRSLAARTGEPNIFHDPDFLLPATKTLGLLGKLETVAAWEAEPADPDRPRLLGVFPFLRVRPWGLPITVARSVTHAYGPAGTPAIDSNAATEVMHALIDAFAATPDLPQLVSIPYLRLDSTPAKALTGTPYRQVHFGGYLRAELKTSLDGDVYLASARRPKQRKRMAQQARQLEKLGKLETRVISGVDVACAANRFLVLEAAGWKGARGTALASSPETETMFRELTGRLGPRGQCEIHELVLDGKVIAAFVLLIAGTQGWLWKGAYDEAYGRYSPGQLLTQDVARHVLDVHPGLAVDSCALPDHPMIDHIFRERLAFADLLLDVQEGGDGLLFSFAVLLENLRRNGRRKLRAPIDLVRDTKVRLLAAVKRRPATSAE